MNFLARDDLYEREKPYQFRYDVANGIPKTNLRHTKQENFKIQNIRGREEQFSFEKNGFTVLKMDEEVGYDDFEKPAGIHRYLDIVAEQLRRKLDADVVQVYQYQVRLRLLVCTKERPINDIKIRKRDASFPVAKDGNSFEFNQPSTIAHVGLYFRFLDVKKYQSTADTRARHNYRRGSKHVPKSKQGPHKVFTRSSIPSRQVRFLHPL